MPRFITIEAYSFWFPTSISLELDPFERSPLLDKISFGFKTQALEWFGLFPLQAILASVPFPFMACFLVRELALPFESGLLTSPHIRKTFYFHDGFG
jgi:hypothetical protein